MWLLIPVAALFFLQAFTLGRLMALLGLVLDLTGLLFLLLFVLASGIAMLRRPLTAGAI